MAEGQAVPPPIDGYRFVKYLGSGGFGAVFQYEEVNTNASVAIKVLRDGALARDGAQELMHEAQALGRLSLNGPHPNIVSVQRPGITGGRPYLVMEFCPGGSWAQKIGKEGRLHPSEVLNVGIQIAGALYMAHRAGIVHRDIKPGNILIGARIGGQRTPKLGDFGIAAVTADEVKRGSVWLSRDYAAPEVVETGEADELSDIFSLAATLYHGLAGRSWVRIPGGDNSTEAMDERISAGNVPPIGGDVPEALEFLLRASMSRDRMVRRATVPTAKDFAQRLQDIQINLRYDRTRIPIEEAGEHTSMRTSPGSARASRQEFSQPRAPLSPTPTSQPSVPSAQSSASSMSFAPPRSDPAPSLDAPYVTPHSLQAPPQMPYQSGGRAPAQWQSREVEQIGEAATGLRADPDRPAALNPQPQEPVRQRKSGMKVGLIVGAVVLVAGGVVAANALMNPDVTPQPSKSVAPTDEGALPGRVPPPTPEVVGKRTAADTVEFTFTYSPIEAGDKIKIFRDGKAIEEFEGLKWTKSAVGPKVCITAVVVRADRRFSQTASKETCA